MLRNSVTLLVRLYRGKSFSVQMVLSDWAAVARQYLSVTQPASTFKGQCNQGDLVQATCLAVQQRARASQIPGLVLMHGAKGQWERRFVTKQSMSQVTKHLFLKGLFDGSAGLNKVQTSVA